MFPDSSSSVRACVCACHPTEWRQAASPAGPRVQASAQDPSPGHPPAEGRQRLLWPQQGEPPVSN